MIRVTLLTCVCAGAAAAECAPDRVDLKGGWGKARFAVEVADDPAERSRGLMFREDLASNAGMLFLYEEAGPVSFWMRNTLIPLDIIFMDETGTVQRVKAEAQPRDETPIAGGDDVLAVLEINGGLAESLGIGPGTVLRHPGLDQTVAAWTCEPG